MSLTKVNAYALGKIKAEQRAIDFQLWQSTQSLSWSECAYYCNVFYKLGKRYGLLKVFRENGIC